MSSKRVRKKASRRPGVALELVVARIQQMMEPNTKVAHDEWIVDRFGIKRQFDVTVRGRFAGREILGVIECKDHSRKKGPDAIEAFAKKAENINANFKYVVSRKGFTKKALTLSEKEGVGCLSLLPNDPKQVGFSVGEFWYGIIKTWGNLILNITFPTAPVPVQGFALENVRWNGLRVIDWFMKEFLTTQSDKDEKEVATVALTFDQVRKIEIDGTNYDVVGLACTATRVFQKKRRWVTWTGDALYDWHTKTFTIPPQGSVVGSSIVTNFVEWDDFHGEIPDKVDFLRCVLHAEQMWNDSVQVPDLESL